MQVIHGKLNPVFRSQKHRSTRRTLYLLSNWT